MNVLLVGATGFIGRATLAYLRGKGHQLTAWVRDTEKARNSLGNDIQLIGPEMPESKLDDALEYSNAVINLAGEPLAGVRWTKNRKINFADSRVGLNKILSAKISNCHNPPSVFISASAVGIYGSRGTELLKESSSIGKGFLPKLCKDWEKAAMKSQNHGTRICTLRIGIVLGREGGILKRILPGFELGVGSYIGDLERIIPWIHLMDVVRAIDFSIRQNDVEGPLNLTAPNPVTGKEFSKTISYITGTKITLPIPPIILKLLLGQGEEILTNSQNVIPEKLMGAGFVFQYKSLESALRNEIDPQMVKIDQRKNKSYTSKKVAGQFELTTSISLKSNPTKTFDFFSSPINLGLATPPWLKFKIVDMPQRVREGSVIIYKIKLGPFWINWRTVIVKWRPNNLFIDSQEKGPFKLWRHEHHIVADGPHLSVMEDKVIYSIYGGILGKILHKLFIKKILIRIFNYRNQLVKLRFQ